MPTIRPITTTFVSCVAESEHAGASIAAEAAPTRSGFAAPIRPFGFAALYRAYQQCRRGKREARNTQAYEARLLDRLAASRDALESFAWRPSRTLAFVTTQPKLREIHAADFSDRVVHHLLVSHLEPLFEPVFIHDSYANRKGKGTHAAVDRLQGFMRQATKSGKRPAFALQLDIANFFNSIDRRILFRLLQKRLAKAVRHGYERGLARALQAHCRALLTADPALNVRRRGRSALFERVPPHKRLGANGSGIGLPIGNLTSQFFANVYLNELDQFVKHTLKARYYVRYVDDFVLLHEDPAQLEQWRDGIIAFLDERLGLRLRGDNITATHGGHVGGASAPIATRAVIPQPRPVSAGSDFLGYVTFPFHRLVRRRVVHNFLARLDEFARRHVRAHAFRLPPAERDVLRARIASYLGHFRHANTWNLWQTVLQRHPWLTALFDAAERANLGEQLLPNWVPPSVTSLASQWRHFARRHPERVVLLQVGKHWLIANRDVDRMGAPAKGKKPARPGFAASAEIPAKALPRLRRKLKAAGIPHIAVAETGYLKSGHKRRELVYSWTPPGAFPSFHPVVR